MLLRILLRIKKKSNQRELPPVPTNTSFELPVFGPLYLGFFPVTVDELWVVPAKSPPLRTYAGPIPTHLLREMHQKLSSIFPASQVYSPLLHVSHKHKNMLILWTPQKKKSQPNLS